nr:FHA domain-containing protein [uncultured Cohaesibacter sp.]
MSILSPLTGVLIAGVSAWITAAVKNAFEEKKQRTEWRKELLDRYREDLSNFQKFSQQFAIGIVFLDDKSNLSELHQKYFIPQNFKYTVGRDKTCDIKIDDQTVSRLHCLVTATNKKIFLEDLVPTNPTLIDGKPISGRIEIKSSLKATIGCTEIEIVKLRSTDDDMNIIERSIVNLLSI